MVSAASPCCVDLHYWYYIKLLTSSSMSSAALVLSPPITLRKSRPSPPLPDRSWYNSLPCHHPRLLLLLLLLRLLYIPPSSPHLSLVASHSWTLRGRMLFWYSWGVTLIIWGAAGKRDTHHAHKRITNLVVFVCGVFWRRFWHVVSRIILKKVRNTIAVFL